MKAQDLHIIYFAGGCFWGVEHYFKQVRGVVETQAGYANGNRARPDYEEVCTGRTGFAETVRVTFDATQVDLDLLFQSDRPDFLEQARRRCRLAIQNGHLLYGSARRSEGATSLGRTGEAVCGPDRGGTATAKELLCG